MKSLSFTLALLVACGGPATDGTTTPTGPGSANPAAAGDVAHELPVIKVEGTVFVPEALGRPGMPLYDPKNKRLTIDQQRQVYAKTNSKDLVLKQAQAAVLATMLYRASKDKTGDEQAQLVSEARKVLREVRDLAKDNVDEATLRLLGSYEIQLEDWESAAKAWEDLVKKYPKHPDLAEHKAWWIYSLLRNYKNAEAAEIAKAETPTVKQPLLAYAIAWARWRANDDAGAWRAIVMAAEGWGTHGNREVVERDVFLLAGRSKAVSPDQVKPELFKLFNATQPALQYEVLSKLGQLAYGLAGRWSDAVATIEAALKLGTSIQPQDRLRLKYYIAQFLIPLDQPDAATRNAKEAIAAMPGCTQCPQQEKDSIVQQIYGMARIFHLLYATANDVRYYQPAMDLYNEVVPLIMDQALRTQAKTDKDSLEKTLRNTKAGTGTHDKQAMHVLLQRHNQAVQACYEEQLLANPKLAGKLVIDLESDHSGEIKGAASEPKAGVADMSGVAGCVVAEAKTWKLPKRGMAGTTRLKLVYNLAPAKS
jgi:hypothetical protein